MLLCGVVFVILRLAVFEERRLVTDGETNARTDIEGISIYRASVASRGNEAQTVQLPWNRTDVYQTAAQQRNKTCQHAGDHQTLPSSEKTQKQDRLPVTTTYARATGYDKKLRY